MAKDQDKSRDYHIRLQPELWKRLEKLADRMSAKAEGVRISKTAVVEKALEAGLERLGL